MHNSTKHGTDADATLGTPTHSDPRRTLAHECEGERPTHALNFANGAAPCDAGGAAGHAARDDAQMAAIRKREADESRDAAHQRPKFDRRTGDAPRAGGYETAVMMPALMHAALPALLLLATTLLPGCALLNESSMSRRADTYDVYTELTFNPRTGQIHAKSSGNDSLRIKGAKFGDNSIDELELVFDRGEVVRAQGQRAKDATELMAQQIALNAEWRMALTESLREIRGIAGDLSATLAPILGAARSTQTRISTPWGDIERSSNRAAGSGETPPLPGWRGAATQPAGR